MNTGSRKDQLTRLQTEYEDTKSKINESKHNCEVILQDTLQIAAKTGEVLNEQTEQIDRIIKKTVVVDKNLNKAEKTMSKMENWFRSIFNIGRSSASTVSYDRDFPEPEQHSESQSHDTIDEHDTRRPINDNDDDDDSQFLQIMNKGIADLKQMAIKQGDVLDYHNYMLPQITETVEHQNQKIGKLNMRTSTLAK
jgi:hypothetical protein